MSFKNLREYISSLEEKGELQRVSQKIDWDLETGAIMRHAMDIKLLLPYLKISRNIQSIIES
tara:strand:- start:446 stop:631 length:186 start_codon:yes stop_codon:yes gene_type:complete